MRSCLHHIQVAVGGAITVLESVLRKMVLHAELNATAQYHIDTLIAESMCASLGSCPAKSLFFWSRVIVGGSCDSLLQMLMVLCRPWFAIIYMTTSSVLLPQGGITGFSHFSRISKAVRLKPVYICQSVLFNKPTTSFACCCKCSQMHSSVPTVLLVSTSAFYPPILILEFLFFLISSGINLMLCNVRMSADLGQSVNLK